jgi:alkylated DNA repair dioxygenase AlkB
MATLFPIETFLPGGFHYHENFITAEEEHALITVITSMDLSNMLFQGFEAKRKTASFGYDWSFEKRTLSKGKDIPPVFASLLNKVASKIDKAKNDFAELLVTEYPVGSVINWHRDAPPFDIIAGISLQSDCIFRLRPHEKIKQNRKSIISLPVKRRSLYIMEGIARTEWQHSIAPVKEVRYSITLRTLKT